ncbi:hypothetical protein AJ79_05661 [Helicocarpus griseus UAMH5409]|uniref:BTB domain-containing protein n=1 Tax=Helicocarpus griseus UAMH5409 TaxID=1447875 RepID=A0A2B7XKY2_9EURO|nr:hypothetical protein AJ79_05661 [Helicocarpus griseus UAMH5409]
MSMPHHDGRLPADPSFFSVIGHNSIIHSPSFTFLVGPEHTKLTIQSGLAKHVSERLDELMNNGHTRESRHRIAVLEEEDVETFVGFCEYAYTGDYSVPNPKPSAIGRVGSQGVAGMGSPLATAARPPAPSPPITPQPGEPQEPAEEGGEGEGAAGAGEEKAEDDQDADANQGESSKGKKPKKGKKKQNGGKAAQALNEGTAANMTPPRTPPPRKEDQSPEDQAAQQASTPAAANPSANNPEDAPTAQIPHIPPSEAVSAAPDWFDFEATPKPEMPKLGPAFQATTGSFLSPKSRGLGLWDEFASLQYVHPTRATAGGLNLPSPLSRNTQGYGIAVSGTEPVPYLLFHAKLYVFATRFLIPTLAQLTLKKLHRGLLSFPLSSTTPDHLAPATAAAVLQLLHYTFTHTTRDDPVFPTEQRQNQLRKLITHYAACKVRELAAYQPPVGVEAMDAGHLGFRDLLDTLGELASDLVFRMM